MTNRIFPAQSAKVRLAREAFSDNRMKSMVWVCRILLFVLTISCFTASAADQANQNRPNILFIMADDHDQYVDGPPNP